MPANYTPLDVQAFEKQYSHRSKSTILFVIIAILSIIVLGLLVYILMQQRP